MVHLLTKVILAKKFLAREYDTTILSLTHLEDRITQSQHMYTVSKKMTLMLHTITMTHMKGF